MKQFAIVFFIFVSTILTTSCQNKLSKTKFKSIKTDEPTDLNQPKKIILKEFTKNADFNYSKLSNIDDYVDEIRSNKNLIHVFEHTNGEYNYYKFIATYKGYKYSESEDIGTFHDILIIKTDENNNVKDAYLYTLEWAEVPLQYDLLKSENLNLKLKNGLEIEKFNFKRIISEEAIEEKGNIYLTN